MSAALRDVQQAVDALASRLGKPTVVEDYQHRVVVYSEHDEPVDEVRRLSILRRHTTTEVVSWLRRQGIVEATQPVRIPGCPELGMLPRVCVPVRDRGMLLGYVWFIDADRDMQLPQVKTAVKATDGLAVLLHDSRAVDVLAADPVGALLAGDQPTRAAAVRAMADEGRLAFGRDVVAIAAKPGADRRAAFAQTLARLAQEHRGLHLVRQDHGVLLCTGSGVAACVAQLYASGTAVAVGIGGVHDRLDRAADSYRQARLALRVAQVQPELGPVARWDGLGVYRVLDSLPGAAVIHPGLARLLADPAHQPLLDTLELYLDLAGNAEETARRLHLHRTSLYYRLGRLEALAGTNLKDGAERLSLHLALKAARLGRT